MTGRRLRAGLLSALAAALFASGAAHPAFACRMSRAAELPITLWQDKLFVPVAIDGSTQTMAVDTGASVTVLASGVASALNLARNFDHTQEAEGIGGASSHLYIADLHSFSIGPVSFSNAHFPVASFAMHMANGTAAAGLLGADILTKFDVEIDIAARRLTLWHADGCATVAPPWQGGYTSLPMTLDETRHVSLPVRIEQSRLQLTLDTGAPGLVLTSRAAAQAGATPDVLEQDRAIGGNGVNDRAFEARLHVFSRVELGDQVFGDVPAAVVQNGRGFRYDGLLGLIFLRRSRVWLSYATGAFYIQADGNY